jgi:hypothetical protein
MAGWIVIRLNVQREGLGRIPIIHDPTKTSNSHILTMTRGKAEKNGIKGIDISAH